jgi:hypothetical protein
MRRILTITAAVMAALAVAAAPAGASAGNPEPASNTAAGGGWIPIPIPPLDAPAGLLCDFAVHYDVIVNEARLKVLQTYADGTPKRDISLGAVFLRVSNAETGSSTVVDTSDTAVTEHGTDGSRDILAVGPVVVLVRAGTSNLARGFYAIDGVTRVAISPTGFKNVTLVHASIHNVCDDLA